MLGCLAVATGVGELFDETHGCDGSSGICSVCVVCECVAI